MGPFPASRRFIVLPVLVALLCSLLAPAFADRTVYIAPHSGTKYHSRSSCRGLSRARSVKAVSFSYAQSHYSPCSICAGGIASSGSSSLDGPSIAAAYTQATLRPSARQTAVKQSGGSSSGFALAAVGIVAGIVAYFVYLSRRSAKRSARAGSPASAAVVVSAPMPDPPPDQSWRASYTAPSDPPPGVVPVYVSSHGSCYHYYRDCQAISGVPDFRLARMDFRVAKQHGKRPCQYCRARIYADSATLAEMKRLSRGAAAIPVGAQKEACDEQ